MMSIFLRVFEGLLGFHKFPESFKGAPEEFQGVRVDCMELQGVSRDFIKV